MAIDPRALVFEPDPTRPTVDEALVTEQSINFTLQPTDKDKFKAYWTNSGVVPRQLSYQELAHDSLTELHEVATMHERKHRMQELSRGCIALPGGFGTLEESFEALTWSQMPVEIHDKPCVFANIDGYYDHLFRFLDTAAERGLLLRENRALARRTTSAVDAVREVQRLWAAAAADIDRAISAYLQARQAASARNAAADWIGRAALFLKR